MIRLLIITALAISACLAHAGTRTVFKDADTGMLIEDIATGNHSIRINSSGALIFEGGMSITGADVFLGALGGTSTGGAGTADAGKLTIFASDGSLTGAGFISYAGIAGTAAQLQPGYIQWLNNGHTMRLQPPNSISADRVISLPNVSVNATVITSADSGTVTNTMLQGNIANSKLLNPYVTVGGNTVALGGSVTASAIFDSISSTRGTVLYRGASGWVALAPGTNGQYLKTQGAGFDPVWVTPSNGITIGTTTTSGAGADDILITDGVWVQKLTPGSGVKGALANAVNGASGFLTYGIIGTSGATVPLLNGSNTFSGVNTFGNDITISTGYGLHLGYSGNYLRTDAYNSVLWDANTVIGRNQANGGNQFAFENGGVVTFGLMYSGQTGAVSNAVRTASYVLDVFSNSHSANLAVYNTWSNGTSWEAFVADWQTTANECHVGTQVGSGGGTARDMYLMRGGADKIKIGANTTDLMQPLKIKSYTVAGLPSASTCGAGSKACVTDATSRTPYTTVSGGGSYFVEVISDGTNWLVH
ncbi:hypothetical protein [Prosthecobacter vanneervenii]|uniref:Uncharacterized protein n=1 Tax=Prosthecobacter vanneervenii TaxID=48466 RepID=A0A7W7YBL3_9BACT|nr:hypothetical protein [Prosthecobacter vanneervenii]MBB5033176.1 hypothetical protein [Prosthecobacter vanneervenii]